MTAAGDIMVAISPIFIFWGFLWMLWDKRSTSPGYVLGYGVVLLIVGLLIGSP